jgi:hypothetical protein
VPPPEAQDGEQVPPLVRRADVVKHPCRGMRKQVSQMYSETTIKTLSGTQMHGFIVLVVVQKLVHYPVITLIWTIP